MEIGFALLGAAFLVAIANPWRHSVKAALILVIFEGALRKWVFPQASDVVYFLKDFVLLGAYIRYFVFGSRVKTRQFTTLKIFLLGSAAIIALQVNNSRLDSVAVGLFGLKAYIWYIPLCFMVGDLFQSETELQTFLKRYLLLSIPVCLLGIVQFFSPVDSSLNTYVAGDVTNIATFGVAGAEHARITGTFSYISGFTSYLFVGLTLVLPLLGLGLNRIWFAISLIELLLLTAGMFMSGSRAPVLTGIMALAGFLLFNEGVRKRSQRSIFIPLVVATAICIGGSLYWFDEALTAFWGRASTSDSASERITEGISEPFEYILKADIDLTGYGTGSTHPGGTALRIRWKISDPLVAPPPAEAEPTRVLLELGVLGFLLWYAARLFLIWALWRTWKNVQQQFLKHLAFAALMVHLLQLTSAVVVNHTAGVYYWFMAGFIFLLPRLDSLSFQKERLRARPSSTTTAANREQQVFQPVYKDTKRASSTGSR